MLYKFKIAVISILIMVMFTTSCCFAETGSQSSALGPGDELDPQYNVTHFIQPTLSFTGRQAYVDVFARVDAGTADRMKVTVTLKKVGSSTPVKTWTDQISMADKYGSIQFADYYTVSSAGTYYYTAVGKMYKNNLVVDSFNVTSYQKSCG